MTGVMSVAPNGQTTTRIFNAIRAIVRAERIGSRALEMKFQTSLAQIAVLQQLRERDAGSLTELAARTMTHQSSVSVVVRRLEERGFVTRAEDPDDRRTLRIAITPAGVDFLGVVPTTLDADLRTALATLPESDQLRLADLLQSLIESARIPAWSPEGIE